MGGYRWVEVGGGEGGAGKWREGDLLKQAEVEGVGGGRGGITQANQTKSEKTYRYT